MNALKKISKFLDNTNDWVGKVSSWSVIIMMLLVVYEVVSRRIFNSPTIWTFEVTTMVFGFHFMMVAAYGVLHKVMVSVDMLYEKFSAKKQAILDLITYTIFFMPFVIGVLYGSSKFAWISWLQKEVSWTAFAPPLYPFKAIIPVAFFFLLLQGISEMIKRIVILAEGEKSHD
ncbi:TRAP-type mannitol/chloroaromatic compound transport system permease small subunit [Cytobacillus oceanisediminis]|uniref:TRAP-type mannitol/chloroaromatic compound transport system permease small subunit n=1 Tax=Cytobacillus oceanisediminis TaxID=665099 RepID=A0A2V3A6G1_9BACI|nr:TRAP transporter small permease subunit [Cytobacillus oceanisediminis]PWW32356.1 TRAP-type mannitol/chloroaromatic compound transport system permease small subunit [Cytobacillus oceanisediminis]